jgi:hypothetical protein
MLGARLREIRADAGLTARSSAFEAVWNRAIPHEDYEPSTRNSPHTH